MMLNIITDGYIYQNATVNTHIYTHAHPHMVIHLYTSAQSCLPILVIDRQSYFSVSSWKHRGAKLQTGELLEECCGE